MTLRAPKVTRAEAAVIVGLVGDQLMAAVRMERDDLERQGVKPPEETEREWYVREAIARSLKLRAAVFDNTCSEGRVFVSSDLVVR